MNHARRRCTRALWPLAVAGAALLPDGVRAQTDLPRTPGAPGDTVVATAGARYAGGAFRRWILGEHYRDLWTTPVRVPVLDLATFAGGLDPERSHVGSQTTSLRLQGRDGRTYQFRSVFKTPAARLRADLQGTVVADILQDGASASHPAGALVVAPLLERTAVLHAAPRLFVMPDDARLGEFRSAFTGLLGWIEERPDEADDEGRGGFGIALRVISPERLFERIQDGPSDQVDARAFLVARLVDILIGDRDRHRDNWRWALLDESGPVRYWQPISRDHDEAFVKLDGLALSVAKRYYPQLTSFEAEFDRPLNLNWHAREVDRRFLAGVDRAGWREAALWVQERLSDSVLVDAVRRLPPELYAVGGRRLTAELQARRDGLVDEVERYYALLAQEVEVHATDADETLEIERVDDRFVTVRVTAEGFSAPWFERRFDARETEEIRVALWGGDDRALIRGAGRAPIRLRVIGGRGRDVLTDSSAAGGVTLYDAGDESALVGGPATRLDRRPYPEWIGSDTARYPPRDWGRWIRPRPFVRAGPDFGLLLGGGVQRTRYGFRKDPYASDVWVRGAVALGDGWGLVEATADLRRENARSVVELEARASGIDVLRHYGLGNATPADQVSAFYKVEVNEGGLEARIVHPLGTRATVRAGPFIRYTSAEADDGPRLFNQIADTVYGAGNFLSAGLHAAVDVSLLGDPTSGPGLALSVAGRLRPPVGDVRESYASVQAIARAALQPTAAGSRLPALGVRVGLHSVYGHFPFQDAARLGGGENLRGLPSDRFAGDRALYANLELRQPVAQVDVILPAEIGIYGIWDVGRVWVDGASPGGWHQGRGGGVWLAFLDRANALSLSVVRSAERTGIYAGVGFGL